MRFSYNAVWEDTMALVRRHAPLLTAIAGVFLFLPALLIAVYLPPPEPPQGTDPSRALELLFAYYQVAAPWRVLEGIVSMVGTLAMLRLVFARDTSVGGALVFGLLLTPFYILLSIVLGVMFLIGFILLIIPGLYLLGRFAPAPALMVAENRRNPIEVVRRTFALTKGNGWSILGMVLIVLIVGLITIGVADALFGLVFILLLGQALGKLLSAVIASALAAAFSTLLIMLYAAIYRALAGADAAAASG